MDHDTRLISLNDHVDKAEDGWEDRSIFSAWHHERSNRDTSNRIKRTHRAKFLQGSCLSVPIYGYVKKPGAKSDDDVERLPEAEAIYKEWFDRLDNGATYSDIADWLNATGVPLGPYCRRQNWDCRIVGRLTHNWLLKGVRFRNKRKSNRNNETGRYKSEKADPSELVVRPVPHLAFFEAAYYDRVVAKADARNAKFCRNGTNGPDPLENRPRKRTRFPGQTIYCGICGRMFVFGGHGQKDHLQCTGSREYRCWNAISVDGPLAAQKISQAVFDQIETIVDFDRSFQAMVNEEALRLDETREDRLRQTNRELRHVRQEIENVVEFIRGGDSSERVRVELRQLEVREKNLLREKDEIEATPSRAIVVPCAKEVKKIAREAFSDLAIDSYEFAKRMRQVTGKILVYPFQLCDGGHIVLREAANSDCRIIVGRTTSRHGKTDAELAALRQQKLTIVYLGLESGSDEVLRRIHKGITAVKMVDAVQKLKRAEIRASVIALLGLGGTELSAKHAEETGRVVSAMDPEYFSMLTVMLIPHTELYRQWRQGTFELPQPEDLLRELRQVIAHCDGLSRCVFRTDHASNYLSLSGTLSRDKCELLAAIDEALAEGRSALRPEAWRAL